MLITQQITILQKIVLVLGVWILTQLGPGYLSTAAAAECPVNTSCVTRYDDEVASDGLNGLNLRQAVGETATSAVFIGATETVTISLNTPLEIRKDISISTQVGSQGQNLVTIRPSESFTSGPVLESTSLIQIFAESATANVEIINLTLNGSNQDSEIQVRAIEVIENADEPSVAPLLTIESSTIKNSYGDSSGGGILTPGDIFVESSIFENNFSFNSGGAISADGQIIILNSEFIENSALMQGGAIANSSTETITVRNSTFESNTAYADFLDEGMGGGAIKGGTGLLEIEDSSFSNNISSENGGAILHFGDIQVSGSSFEANSAGSINEDEWGEFVRGSGGAIFSSAGDRPEIVNVSIDSSSFLGNQAAQDGGAIEVTGIIEITNSDFQRNSTMTFLNENEESIYDGDGGAVRVQGKIDISQSSFFYNIAAGDGGALDIDTLDGLLEGDTTSIIFLSDFRFNESIDGDGGALNGSMYNLIVDDSYFLANIAEDDGGAISSRGLVITLDSDFRQNFAYDDGGAIYGDSVQINQSLFLDNQSGDDGGAINVQNDESESILSIIMNTEFDGNVSISGQGNTLYGNAWLLLNSFVNYRTRDSVSAIALETNFGAISIGNSFIEQNPAVSGDNFCTIGFNLSANNLASDSSCFGDYEVDPVKSRVATAPGRPNEYLYFSDSIFIGETGLLTVISDLAVLGLFIDSERERLEESLGRLPTDAEAIWFESLPSLRRAALLDCYIPVEGSPGTTTFTWECLMASNELHVEEEEMYVDTFGVVSELNLMLEDANDINGHQFIQDYLFIDRNYFDRVTTNIWTAGAVHIFQIPVVVSIANTFLFKSSIFVSLEEQKLRAERVALAEAKKKVARSLRLAEIEKRRNLITQMRAKMAQTQIRGEMLKLKKQWQNLMKNFTR